MKKGNKVELIPLSLIHIPSLPYYIWPDTFPPLKKELRGDEMRSESTQNSVAPALLLY